MLFNLQLMLFVTVWMPLVLLKPGRRLQGALDCGAAEMAMVMQMVALFQEPACVSTLQVVNGSPRGQ